MQTEKCDILICGAGLTGLSLLYRAMKSGTWKEEQIIVIDASAKLENDKTWSFWKKEPTDFDELIYREWKELIFFSHEGQQIPLECAGYSYNAIRSIDFYRHVLSSLGAYKNIRFVQDEVLSISNDGAHCSVVTRTHRYQAAYLFNSLYKKPELRDKDQYFLQHFKGLVIKVAAGIPEKTAGYLMDFRTGQEHGTTFFYTFPRAADELFVEYTLFSKSLLREEEYDLAIREYLGSILNIHEYDILETEFGVVPMTDYRFRRFDGGIVHIGSIGGDTRASTGYTFMNAQKTIGSILASWKEKGNPYFEQETLGLKHQLYDTTLLNVLATDQYKGHELFADLFTHTPASVIFGFLDGETSLLQDMQVMKSLRVMPFLKAFSGAVYRNFRI